MEQFPELIVANNEEWKKASTTNDGYSYDGPIYQREGYGESWKLGILSRDGKFWSCADEQFFLFRAVRKLSQQEERDLASATVFSRGVPCEPVDNSVPRFGPYDPYLHHDEERTWTTRFRTFIVLETRARFPWIRITRY